MTSTRRKTIAGALAAILAVVGLAACEPGTTIPIVQSATAQPDGRTIRVKWDAVTADTTSYEIWYRQSGTSDWVWSGTSDVGENHRSWVPVGAGQNTGVFTRDFKAPGIVPGGTYELSVRSLGPGRDPSDRTHEAARKTVTTPQDWTLTFSDEFNGTALDQNKWNVYPWGVSNYYSCMKESNVSVSGGSLRLAAKSESSTCNGGQTLPYTGSYIGTHAFDAKPSRFNQAYGRWVFRAKTPTGKGLWPAIWLTNVNGASQGELDILEAVGVHPTRFTSTLHYYPAGQLHRKSSHNAITSPTMDLTSQFRTYELIWTPCRIAVYVDGHLQKEWTSWFDNGAMSPAPFNQAGPMNIRLDNKVGYRNSSGNLEAAMHPANLAEPHNPFTTPRVFEIDYVRVYSKPSYALPSGCPNR